MQSPRDEVVGPIVRALSATAKALSFAEDDDDVRAQLEEELAGMIAKAKALLETAGEDEDVTVVRVDPAAEVTLVRRPTRPTPRIVPPRRRR